MKYKGLIISGIAVVIALLVFAKDWFQNSRETENRNKILEKAREAKAAKALQNSVEDITAETA
jgi:H+/gluconate symporter-like permease